VLRDFVRSLKEKRAACTVRNVVNTLTVFLHDALAEEWITLPANPMEHPLVREIIPVQRTKAGRRTIIHLSLKQFAALLASPTLDEAWRVRYLVAGLTGLDDGELAGLKWDDLELDADPPRLEVRRALRLTGKKGKPDMGPPKRDSRYRTVPLHPLVIEALQQWRDGRCTQLLGAKPEGNDPVFPSDRGRAHRPRSAAQLRDDLRAAGLSDTYEGFNITFKALRRSFASWLEAADVSRERRDRLMGHVPEGVGPTHYTHAELRRLYDAVCSIILPAAG
jgi:integrase